MPTVPVDHDPFEDHVIPVDHDPFAVPVGEPSGQVPRVLGAVGRSLADWFAAPGRVAQGQQPRAPGQWSDEDEAIRQANAAGEADWGAQTATNMVGTPGGIGGLGSGIRAYHGSPHNFERFSTEHIGTGEGAQAYGHGLYFAENPATAQSYKEALGVGAQGPEAYAHRLLNYEGGNIDAAIARATKEANSAEGRMFPEALNFLKAAKEGTPLPKPPGKMYEVNINADPEHFLDWDKPLSEQHPKVQEAFAQHMDRPDVKVLRDYLGNSGKPVAGADIYRTLAASILGEPNQQANATRALRQAGIPGIKYLDQGSRITAGVDKLGDSWFVKGSGTPYKTQAEAEAASRAAGNATHNFVVFDDKLIDIVKKYGLAGLVAGGAAHMTMQSVDHDPFEAKQ